MPKHRKTESNTDPAPSYDTIIVGGGIAGMYCAIELLKKDRSCRLALFEKYEGVGGRVHTYRGEPAGRPVQWEAGAGRICSSHELVLGLMKRYGLHWDPIGTGIQYKESPETPLEPNLFEPAIPVMLDTLAGLPQEELAKHTVRQLLTRIHGAASAEKYLIRFPYRAEVDTMRADAALVLFRKEMHGHEGYGICREGLGAIIRAMRKELERRGGTIFTQVELQDIEQVAPGKVQAAFWKGGMSEGASRPTIVVAAARAILALPSGAVAALPAFRRWETLRHLRAQPLVRIFGVFPRDEDGSMWYEEYGGRIVTASPVRYMIPGNPAQGYAQISYTDSQDAQYWIGRLKRDGDKVTGQAIVEELRRLLKPTIPSGVFFKSHVWEEGATYWLPGSYDHVEASRASWRPMPDAMPGVYACGESFSLRQGWIEGALESAEALVRRLKA